MAPALAWSNCSNSSSSTERLIWSNDSFFSLILTVGLMIIPYNYHIFSILPYQILVHLLTTDFTKFSRSFCLYFSIYTYLAYFVCCRISKNSEPVGENWKGRQPAAFQPERGGGTEKGYGSQPFDSIHIWGAQEDYQKLQARFIAWGWWIWQSLQRVHYQRSPWWVGDWRAPESCC